MSSNHVVSAPGHASVCKQGGRAKMRHLRLPIGGGGGGRVGGGKGLNVRHCVHQFVQGISSPPPPFFPIPPSSPPFLFSLHLAQLTSNDSQINKSRHQWAAETQWQVDQSTGTTTTTSYHCNRHCHHHHRLSQQPAFDGALSMATCFRRGSILRFWHFFGWLLVLESFFLLLLIVINFSCQQWQELSFAFREVSRVGGGGGGSGVSHAGYSPMEQRRLSVALPLSKTHGKQTQRELNRGDEGWGRVYGEVGHFWWRRCCCWVMPTVASS